MAYKTFANGFPLPASDLNNYLMNQSVIVFADSTARTAALPTPTEGMITYLEDTDSLELWDGSAWEIVNDNSASIPKSTVTTAGDLIVADGASSVTRLGVGTDDQVLTLVSGAPAWADAGGGGGSAWTLLSTTNLTTAVTTITGIDQSYKDLKIEGINIKNSSAGAIELYLKNGAGTTQSNGQMWSDNSNPPNWYRGLNNDINVLNGTSLNTGQQFNFEMKISNYSSSTHQKPWSIFGGGYFGSIGSGVIHNGYVQGNDAIEQFLINVAGTAISGSEIKIYGAN